MHRTHKHSIAQLAGMREGGTLLPMEVRLERMIGKSVGIGELGNAPGGVFRPLVGYISAITRDGSKHVATLNIFRKTHRYDEGTLHTRIKVDVEKELFR